MRSALFLCASLLLAHAGCQNSGYAELGLVEVSGTIKLDGKPLPSAKVAFESEDKRSSIGITDSSGNYTLDYDSQTKGAPPGPKIVRITSAAAEVEGGGASEGAPAAKETIPARYNTQSTLKADVSASNKTFNFDLTTTP